MKTGDRVMWRGGLGGFNRVYGIVARADKQFNPQGHEDIEGYMVRPDGWDHNYFIAAEALTSLEE